MIMNDVYSLSEEDIKLRYITPAIIKQGWSVTDITMETKVKPIHQSIIHQSIIWCFPNSQITIK
jgi:type I site-specific restriction endonuclease